MKSALYYPHTEVRNERLLKRMLLLWDRVRFIAPYPGYAPQYPESLHARAIELFGDYHYPTDTERAEAHGRIADLVEAGTTTSFQYSGAGDAEPYPIYHYKFPLETWNLLKERGLKIEDHPTGDAQVSEPLGLSMMGILADACAGETFARITDRGDSYAKLVMLFSSHAGERRKRWLSKAMRAFEEAHVATAEPGAEQLVPITLELLDLDNVRLWDIVEMRERERREKGYALRDLRHHYLESLETHATELVGKNDEDSKELRRVFAESMKADLSELKDQLRAEARDAVLSPVILAIVAAIPVAAAALPLAGVVTALGGPVAIGGAVATGSKYRKARQKVLTNHPMAYVYELGGGPRF